MLYEITMAKNGCTPLDVRRFEDGACERGTMDGDKATSVFGRMLEATSRDKLLHFAVPIIQRVSIARA